MSDPGDDDSDDVEERPSVRCSFCRKNPREVGTVLEGPWGGEGEAVYICHECAALCVLIFRNEQEEMLAAHDDDVENPSDAAARESLKKKIDQHLKTLTYREREIIKLRYGLADGYTHTLEEVRRLFNLTHERVREIEAGAVTKLHRALREKDEHPPWHPRLFEDPDQPSP
jgi:RNA polymerase sigma factor (sigma-70 family)